MNMRHWWRRYADTALAANDRKLQLLLFIFDSLCRGLLLSAYFFLSFELFCFVFFMVLHYFWALRIYCTDYCQHPASVSFCIFTSVHWCFLTCCQVFSFMLRLVFFGYYLFFALKVCFLSCPLSVLLPACLSSVPWLCSLVVYCVQLPLVSFPCSITVCINSPVIPYSFLQHCLGHVHVPSAFWIPKFKFNNSYYSKILT